MYLSAWVTIIKISEACGLNNRSLVSHSPWGDRANLKAFSIVNIGAIWVTTTKNVIIMITWIITKEQNK